MAARSLANLTEKLSFRSHLFEGEAKQAAEHSSGSADILVSSNLDKALPHLVSDLRERFRAAGVDLSEPIQLKEDGHGGVVVNGDHPDRSLIEDIFAGDSKLTDDFQQVAAAAVQQRQNYSLSSDNPFGEFRLNIDGGSAAIRFE
jgi:hypothetical protein